MTNTIAPLAGLTVLEVGVFMAGPFATMQLADLGARVIKIENPVGGDQTRETGPYVNGESAPFALLNRNKESVTIDLKSEEGKQQMWRLLEQVDVLVENLRPGALTRLGFGYDAVSTRVPELIYASGSGWGQDGPLAQNPGLDIMAQARSGMMSVTGHPGMPPAKIGVPICDLTTGLYLALAVTAATRERDRSGRGQHIDISLLESAVSLSVWEAGVYFTNGTVSGPLGSAHAHQAPYQALQCSDGWATVGANTEKLWRQLAAALDVSGLTEDPRFSSGPLRVAHRGELAELLERRTSRMTVDEVVAAANAAGVPSAPILDYSQVFNDEHLQARSYFWDAPHPVMGKVRQLGSPMRFSRTPVVREHAGPLLGADTEKVFAEFDVLEASSV
ncbi:MAG TPA: CoA transferase [Microbacterium sp.]|nr:CoA transferase [Microbacterium sp.]